MRKGTRKVIYSMCVAAMLGAVVTGCGSKDAETDAQTTQADTTAETTEAVKEQGTEQTSDTIELEGYNLLWNDEFDGTELDDSIWTRELREPGWTNNELQEYTDSDENIFLRDGKLVLKAVKTTDENGKDYYTSGKVNSQNKKDFLYGKVVARAKVPAGQGLWPAIWMMPQVEEHYGQWPKCGEIDIMEVLGNQTELAYSTIHYGEPHGEQQGTYTLEGTTFADDFHDYSVEWEPGEIRFYIDNNLILTANDWYTCVEGEEFKPYPAPFDQTFFVQMNLAVGGNWPGNPDATTDFDKAEFEIDYVRVYQKDEYDTNVERPQANYREADENGNFIHNATFAEAEDLTDDVDWKFLLFADGKGSAEIKDNMIVIQSENAGTEEYSVQLVQPEIPAIHGKTYRLTFEACAEEERNIITCVSAPNVGWIRYLEDTSLALTTDWQTFTYEYTVTGNDDPASRLEFNLGNQGSTATVSIRNVVLEEVQ